MHSVYIQTRGKSRLVICVGQRLHFRLLGKATIATSRGLWAWAVVGSLRAPTPTVSGFRAEGGHQRGPTRTAAVAATAAHLRLRRAASSGPTANPTTHWFCCAASTTWDSPPPPIPNLQPCVVGVSAIWIVPGLAQTRQPDCQSRNEPSAPFSGPAPW